MHSHSHFPRTTLQMLGTINPHLATKYNDEEDNERLAFLDPGFPMEAWVINQSGMCIFLQVNLEAIIAQEMKRISLHVFLPVFF